MFYSVDSLRKGGRFYLCWIADSWPLQFATITQRQLWSQDIRKICDDLLRLITNESGRPTNRFSLRLSSQLIRGLARLYQKKTLVLLDNLCMINANVMKNTNKKWNILERVNINFENIERPQILIEEIEDEEPLLELIEQSGNVVRSIQDITLKEATLPVYQAPTNDGFGEEIAEQPLQMLSERSVELMLGRGEASAASAAQHSALELPALDLTDKSHDRSRLAPHDTLHMERISEHDLTLFTKSIGDELLPGADFEKDIPQIPEIPLPGLPAPSSEKIHVVEQQEMDTIVMAAKETEEEMELEELEETEVQAKKRRLRTKHLIIDKKIKISGNVFRNRLKYPTVELRCKDSSDDIINLTVPSEILMHRPAHVGVSPRSNIATTITRLFVRNLGVLNSEPLNNREMEKAMANRNQQTRNIFVLERIDEELYPEMQVKQHERPDETNISKELVPDITANSHVSVQEPVDVSEVLFQKIETSTQAQKRTSEYYISPKKQRLSGYVSFRRSQELASEAASIEKNILLMLQEAGPSDIQPKNGSEKSETPLGSLDRTKVSLGDSDKTTESIKLICDQWGTENTMKKIIICIKDGIKPITVDNLISKGPIVAGRKSMIAARCFTSILKLKQRGFIKVYKDAETLEIKDITLGPKFDGI